jgi:glycerophosphoryl diester phosphodiesterase
MLAALLCANAATGIEYDDDYLKPDRLEKFLAEKHQGVAVQLGSRPKYLIGDMAPGGLQRQLAACENHSAHATDFSIAHRGAPLRFAEHTLESYVAAARQGAGIVECDVTFTRDRELVCRHSQCDLHTTTNILQIPELAAKCSQPFTPYDPATNTPASARCCTSDITLREFKSLQGKIDAANPRATTVDEYLSTAATAGWRSDSYSGRGTLLTHAESIQLFSKLGVGMTPELKAPSVPMPYQGNYSQRDYAQQMIDEYKAAGISPQEVRVQSFNLEDVIYWIENEPQFGRQAVYLDNRVYDGSGFEPSLADFESLKRSGVEIVAPPMFALLTLDAHGNIVPSAYAELARAAGLDIITWTFERTELRDGAQPDDFYYQSIAGAIKRDGDRYLALDALATKVGIRGIFSDWPASVTYYANCMGLE